MGRLIPRLLGSLLIVELALVIAPGLHGRASASPPDNRLSGVDFLTGFKTVGQEGAELQRIKADGANTVSFDVWWEVPSSSSSIIAPAPGVTDSDADLLAGSQQAAQAGLDVVLTPKIVIGTNANNSGWRGEYSPPDPATFFSGYQRMVDHYASLAQEARMSMFLVGSEMIASDGYAGYWRQIVASARQHFSGPISYEVDWREIPQFSWGDALDVLLLSAYFPLSDGAYPTLAELDAGWHAYRPAGASKTQDAFSEVAGLAQRWGKRVVFGEAGYMATTYPAREPWWNAPNDGSDPDLQYLAYKALLDTFVAQPWWGGVLWWAWDNGDPRSPENKPAEHLIGVQSVEDRGPDGAPPTGGGPPSAALNGRSGRGTTPLASGSPGGTAAGGAVGAPTGGSASFATSAPASGTVPRGDTAQPATAPPGTRLVSLAQAAEGENGVAAGLALGVLTLAVAGFARLRAWPHQTRLTRMRAGLGRGAHDAITHPPPDHR